MKNLFFVLILSPLISFCQVGNDYKNFLHGDFVNFFHATEIKRTPYKGGDLREMKAGGYQDYITIWIYSDTASGTIHETTIEIDRSWIEGEDTREFARDLVKSFLLDLLCSADQPKAMPAGDLLFNRKATKDQFALDVLDVFNNKKDSLTRQFSKCIVTMENFKKDERVYLRVKIGEAGK